MLTLTDRHGVDEPCGGSDGLNGGGADDLNVGGVDGLNVGGADGLNVGGAADTEGTGEDINVGI